MSPPASTPFRSNPTGWGSNASARGTSEAGRGLAWTERGDRHPFHHDDFAFGPDAPPIDHAEHDLDLGVPRLRVDTTAGYAPSFDQIVAFLREQAG